jgi:hypothetical protein
VDDINPGEPLKEYILPADYFLELMDNYTSEKEANRESIRNCSVIWVLGNDDSKSNRQDDWEKMLHGIGVSKDHICAVRL